MTKPFRFAVMSGSGGPPQAFRDRVRQIEDLGYATFLFNDHVVGPGPAMEEANHAAQDFAAIPAVAVAAEATERLRVGFRVLCVDYHHPVVLAKSMATLDVLSEGRLEIGIGAGWITSEYAAMNIPFDRPGIRIARLSEVIDLLDACFGPEQVAIDGMHAKAAGFDGWPKPVQRPRPPVTVGGGGRKILELAARKADIVGFSVNNAAGKLSSEGPAGATAEVTDGRVAWVRAAAGDRVDDLEFEVGAYFSAVTPNATAAAEAFVGFVAADPASVIAHPHALIGSVDAICDRIIERRERWGFSYITVLDRNVEEFAPVVERLAGT